jgi:hypothetical protein
MSWILLNLVQYKRPVLVQAALSLLRELGSIRHNLLHDLQKVELMMLPKQVDLVAMLKKNLSRLHELTSTVSSRTVHAEVKTLLDEIKHFLANKQAMREKKIVLPLDSLPGTSNHQAQKLLNHLGAASILVELFKAMLPNHAVHVHLRRSSLKGGIQTNVRSPVSELLFLCIDTICDYLRLNNENQVCRQALDSTNII